MTITIKTILVLVTLFLYFHITLSFISPPSTSSNLSLSYCNISFAYIFFAILEEFSIYKIEALYF